MSNIKNLSLTTFSEFNASRKIILSKSLCLIIFMMLLGIFTRAQTSITKVDTFYSPSVELNLNYIVILPSNYAASDRDLPVVYLLHGHTGNYTSWITYARLPVQLATKYDCIIVLPDGGNSWYVNWNGQTDGKPHLWEDMIVKDLIPTIDKKYRTIKNRDARAIGGLSMGGYGALAVGLKNHSIFGFVFSSAGSINFCKNIKNEMAKDTLDWNSPQLWSNGSKILNIESFGTQKERTPQGLVFKTASDADIYDPYSILEKTDTEVLPYIHIDCGNSDDFLDDAYQYERKVQAKTKRHSFITFQGQHEVPYWEQAIEHTFLVMKQQNIFHIGE